MSTRRKTKTVVVRKATREPSKRSCVKQEQKLASVTEERPGMSLADWKELEPAARMCLPAVARHLLRATKVLCFLPKTLESEQDVCMYLEHDITMDKFHEYCDKAATMTTLLDAFVRDAAQTMPGLHLAICDMQSGMKQQEQTCRVMICMLNGRSFEFPLYLSETVERVKSRLSSMVGNIPSECQELVFRGRMMDNDRTVASYGVTDKDQLFVILPPSSVGVVKMEEEDSSQSKQQLSVQTSHGSKVSVFVKDIDTIQTLKTTLEPLVGIKVHDQVVVLVEDKWKTMCLDDDTKTIAEYKLTSASRLSVVERVPPLSVTKDCPIIVRNLMGQDNILMVKATDTVRSVKEHIQQMENIPVDQQRLIHKGTQLEDERLLGSYEMCEYATLHLLLRLRGGMFYFVSKPTPASAALLQEEVKRTLSSYTNKHYFYLRYKGNNYYFTNMRLDVHKTTTLEDMLSEPIHERESKGVLSHMGLSEDAEVRILLNGKELPLSTSLASLFTTKSEKIICLDLEQVVSGKSE